MDQTLQRDRLVRANEAGVSDHVGGKNGGKPAFQALSPSPRRLTTKDRRIHAVEMAVECPLVAISGLFGAVPRRSALPPKADIRGARTVRTQKADIGCPLNPQ